MATVNITYVYQTAAPRPIDPEALARSIQRFEELPLDEVPAPAPLPAGSHMPLARNALFVGREADLKGLAGALLRVLDPSRQRCHRLQLRAWHPPRNLQDAG